jgi:hypothetical protein
MAQAKLNRSLSEEPKQLRKNVDKKSRNVRMIKPKNKSTESLWEMAARLRAQVPPEEWDKLPTDLAKNVDHYLYGAKKISW